MFHVRWRTDLLRRPLRAIRGGHFDRVTWVVDGLNLKFGKLHHVKFASQFQLQAVCKENTSQTGHLVRMSRPSASLWSKTQ